MAKEYLFFISHSSKDNALALELYDIMVEMRPEWKDQIFLDCLDSKPLDNSPEWYPKLMQAVKYSKHLIFITSNINHVKEGEGWLYEEVREFRSLQVKRIAENRPDFNVSYFGIFLCACDFKKLYNDPKKGDEYRNLYQWSQHMDLGEGASLQKAKDRIRSKIRVLTEDKPDDDFAMKLLGKVKEFRENQVKRDTMLAAEKIIDALLPPLMLQPEDSDGDTKIETGERLEFEDFCELAQKKNVQLIGRSGGSGKTTLMTKLFHHQLKLCEADPDNQAIPLYIEAKSLISANTLILRHLSYLLFKDATAITSAETHGPADELSTAFMVKRKSPRYMLLIDGYNELSQNSLKLLNSELEEYLPEGIYESVRLVISSREVCKDLPKVDFTQVNILSLEDRSVRNYLDPAQWQTVSTNKSLKTILRTPLYLQMYKEAAADSDIQTKTALLEKYMAWEERKGDGKNLKAMGSSTTDLRHILLRHVLPGVAHRMVTDSGSTFLITRKDLELTLKALLPQIQEEFYGDYYEYTYREQLETSGLSDIKPPRFADMAIVYFERTFKFLRQESKNVFEFSHQVYRDFFCAWYIAEEIKRSLAQDKCCESLSLKLLDGDILEFVTDLLGEKKPWEYAPGEASCLVQMLAQCREGGLDTPATCVANILKLLRSKRRKDLWGLDFSGLDLTEADLQDCTFFREGSGNCHPTSFAGARIHRENLFTESHYNDLLAACTNDEFIACLDKGGFLKLWEKKVSPAFPVKTLTGIRHYVTKLLFSHDGTKLYGMAANEILEIPIPKERISKAQPRILFRSAAHLRDLMLNEQGELLFSTNANAFHYKKISDPDAPDTVGFYSLNSAAAVNAGGTCLAYGFIAGHEELKILDRSADGIWQERAFGFSPILADFVRELEGLFCSFGMQDSFPCKCSLYFARRRQDFMDRTHRYEETPQKILEKCLKDLKCAITDEQNDQLKALAGQYRQRIKTALDEEGVLIHLNGRRITGLDFHKDGKTLLISGTIDYKDKMAAEDDTGKDKTTVKDDDKDEQTDANGEQSEEDAKKQAAKVLEALLKKISSFEDELEVGKALKSLASYRKKISTLKSTLVIGKALETIEDYRKQISELVRTFETGKKAKDQFLSSLKALLTKMCKLLDKIVKLDQPDYDNWIVTLDTETLTTRLISIYKGRYPNRAFYCGDDIVVMTKHQVNVYDENGVEKALLRSDFHQFRNLLPIPGKETFYAISDHHIYEMDQQLHCIRSLRNNLNKSRVYYFQDAQGNAYLCPEKEKKKDKNKFRWQKKSEDEGENAEKDYEPDLDHTIMDLRMGKKTYGIQPATTPVRCATCFENGEMAFEIIDNRLIAFRHGLKVDEMSIHHNLHVCGCDFRGIQLTETDAEYMMEPLYRMGALTDSLSLPEIRIPTEDSPFTPASGAFDPPKNLPVSYYAHRDHISLKGKSYGSKEETWATIQADSLTGQKLYPTDLAILEWLNQLRYATSQMINELAEAGLIPQLPDGQRVGERLGGALLRNYQLVFRTKLHEREKEIGHLIGSIHHIFGSKLLYHINGWYPRDPLWPPKDDWDMPKNKPYSFVEIRDSDRLKEIRRTLALNSWFTATAKCHKDKLEDYALNTKFATDCYYNSKAKIHGYIRLGGQAFFGQAFRNFDSTAPEEDIINKVTRLCILAQYYPSLTDRGIPVEGLDRQPILVLIGEDMEQCRQLNAHIQHIHPNVRKLFTFDTLLGSTWAAAGTGNYFEFTDGTPHGVKLEDLIP